MAKRGVYRRRPGEEPDFPALMHRPYAMPLSEFNLADIDVAVLRRKLELSQMRFAHRFGFPVATLRHWEQGTRKPRGCALALLHVIAYHPSVATRAILRAKRLGKGLAQPGSALDFSPDSAPDSPPDDPVY